MSPVVLSGNDVPAPRTGDDQDGDGDAMGTTLPAGMPGRAGRRPTPPPVRPTIILAGGGQHDLAARLLGVAVPEPVPGSYLVLRHGDAGVRAFIPGHRAPRDDLAGGPLTRPPRRVVVTAPANLLRYVHLVVAPDEAPSPAGTAVLADAVGGADGLLYLLDAAEPPPPSRRDELAALAAAAGRLLLIDVRDGTDAERAAVLAEVPAVVTARWRRIDDLSAIAAELRTGPWLAGDRDEEDCPRERSERPQPGPGAGVAWTEERHQYNNTVTQDDAAWREVLAATLPRCRTDVDRRFAADLDALVGRIAPAPSRLPAVLDTELHALSLRTTAALDAAARGLVATVFGAVVEGRLGEAELVRVTTAVWRQLDPDDRTLLITATAGVAAVAGASDSHSATGLTPPTLVAPICLAVSGNCHLMWHYRGIPDQAEARRWLEHAAAELRGSVSALLDLRFAALAEAVGALAGDAVDHGVLLA